MQIFSKKLRAAKKQLSRSGYSVIFSVIIGRWTIFPLPPAAEGRMQAQAMPYSSGNCIPPVWRASPAKCAGKLRSPPSRTPTHKRRAAWYRTAADTASSRVRRWTWPAVSTGSQSAPCIPSLSLETQSVWRSGQRKTTKKQQWFFSHYRLK